jgi:hypothetical protein
LLAVASLQGDPLTKSIHDRGVLKPVDLAKLQRVFDEACRNCEAEPDSDDAREIALRLLVLHDAGLVEEELLVAATSFRPLKIRTPLANQN